MESGEDKRKEAGWWPGEECKGEKDRDAQVGHGSKSTSEDQATQRNEVADPPGSHRWPQALGGGRRRTGWGTDRQRAVRQVRTKIDVPLSTEKEIQSS